MIFQEMTDYHCDAPQPENANHASLTVQYDKGMAILDLTEC